MTALARKLINWYDQAGRDLPWRHTSDPYTIWIAEIVLQQTRIAQGQTYFENFIQQFPDVKTLAEAPREQVLKAWEGLGYYSRAKNLHKAAQAVVASYDGQLPRDHLSLQKLPGIGPYTGRAIASFAFGEQVAVVDGNVLRVISRVEGDRTPIDEQKRYYQALADRWLGDAPSAPFNHALMDLGATICTPRQPACSECPLQPCCVAHQADRTAELPRKAKQLQRKTRYFDYYWLERPDGRILLQQRGEDQFWQNLWELPHREREHFEAPPDPPGPILGHLTHEFTHFRMYIRLVHTPAERWPAAETQARAQPNYAWILPAEARQYALPRAMQRLVVLRQQPDLPFR
jgi:A/G-specific adenine glycosylase